jgi:hypothetical protein
MYVDEENPARIPRSRLRALGMTNEHGMAIAYYCRQGFTVGDAATNRKLSERIKSTGATLLVIDTLMAATDVGEINSNDEVVRFYKAMRAVTEATGVTVLILHHERKPAQGQKAGTGYSSMGARQIAGQSDGHLTLQLKEKSVSDRADAGRTTEPCWCSTMRRTATAQRWCRAASASSSRATRTPTTDLSRQPCSARGRRAPSQRPWSTDSWTRSWLRSRMLRAER